MVKKVYKKIFISLCIVMGMVLFCVQGYAVEDKKPHNDEGFVLSDDLKLSKDIVPYGKAQDRIYQVNLSVTGELETFIKDAHVFLLIDLTPLNQNVYGMWSYYMRAIWNMCYQLIEDYPQRTFYFHLIAYNHKTSPVMSETFKVSHSHQEQLGNLLDIYTKDGKPIYETGRMYDYYNPILNDETILGKLSKISKYSLPQFQEGNPEYESMDYPDKDLVCHAQKYPNDYISADTNVHNAVNLEGALKEMNRIIEEKNLDQSQAVLLTDTLPSASVNGMVASQGEIEKVVDILRDTYDEYEISKKKYEVLFHVFGLKAYTGNQEEYQPLWQEFIKAIGENKIRQKENGQYKGGYFDTTKQEYVPYHWDSSSHDNDYQFEWDHDLGSAGNEEQKRTIRMAMNESLKEVGESVGNGLITVPNYANIVYLQDIIPSPFHIYETKDLHDKVTASENENLNGLIGRVDKFIKNNDGSLTYIEDHQTFQAKDRWKTQGIRWKINRLLSDDGTYTFTYYVQANEDYFGGELIPANLDAALYYMNYEQWVNVGCPTDDGEGSGSDTWESKDFTKEDFIYQIDKDHYVLDSQGNYVKNPQKSENSDNDDTCDIDVYVPYFQNTKDGIIRIFYGDEAQITKAPTLSSYIFEDMKGHNDTTSPNIHYYYQQFPIVHESNGNIFSQKENWKDRMGQSLKFHYTWNVLNNEHQPLYVMEEGDGYLGDIVSDFVIEPDDTVIYQLSYTLSNNQNIKSVSGVWDSLKNVNGERKEFDAYTKTSVEVLVDVVFGSLKLEKEIIGSDIMSLDEIEKIGFQTGFPINIQGPISTIPTLRHHEDIILSRLKRGTYKLSEIVPQKFLLHCYEDQYRYIGNDKVVSQDDYEIIIGFDENTILQNNYVVVKNEIGLKEWESAITEIDNLFEIKQKGGEISK